MVCLIIEGDWLWLKVRANSGWNREFWRPRSRCGSYRFTVFRKSIRWPSHCLSHCWIRWYFHQLYCFLTDSSQRSFMKLFLKLNSRIPLQSWYHRRWTKFRTLLPPQCHTSLILVRFVSLLTKIIVHIEPEHPSMVDDTFIGSVANVCRDGSNKSKAAGFSLVRSLHSARMFSSPHLHFFTIARRHNQKTWCQWNFGFASQGSPIARWWAPIHFNQHIVPT